MQSLYIATNEWLLYEYLCVQEELKIPNVYVTIESGYNKFKENNDRIEDVILALVGKVFNGYIRYKTLKNMEFDTIFCPSNPYDTMVDKLKTIECNKYILLEEGSFDYGDKVTGLSEWADGTKYVAFPEKVKHNNCKELKQIKFSKTAHDFMLNTVLKEKIEALPKEVDTLVFTPPSIDNPSTFVRLVNEQIRKEMIANHSNSKNVLVCKHPRDNYEYIGLKSVEGIPGQFLNEIYKNAKVKYIHDSTVKIYEELSHKGLL